MSIEEIAFHEAGHAAMSIILNLPFNYISIEPDGEFSGTVNPGDDFKSLLERVLRNRYVTDDEKIVLRKYVMVIYAGPMSHGFYLKNPFWQYYLAGDSDYQQAYQILQLIYVTEPEKTDKRIELRDDTMLLIQEDETQEIIKKIANALLTGKHRLTYQECLEVLK
ncbi:MAG TPA: hypothetical protein VGQ53_08645 [Chitinophagaceae bacterium]|jgi:hypothetical protein|nr:hypothetical protein [Chitinophagaceae bacterium]